MNKIFLIFLFFLTTFRVDGKTNYNDIVLTDEFVCALTQSGSLTFFDKQTGKPITPNLDKNFDFTNISTDINGRLIVVDQKNNIKRLNHDNKTFELIGTTELKLFYVLFNSKNECYVITEKGIESIKTGKIYFSDKSLNHQIRYKDKWGKPYCCFIDRTDKIWLGFGYGEWGGNLFIFETLKNKFTSPILDNFNIALWPVKSFFEDDTCTYLSSGLQHMMTSGTIIKFKNMKASTLFNSESKYSESIGKDSVRTMIDAEYIGPTTYNKYDKSIYFYSQNGFFKGNVSKDLSKIDNWTNILKPKLHWIYGQPDAVGSPMNVYKILIIDNNRFVFLTQNDGIGYYDGQNLAMYD